MLQWHGNRKEMPVNPLRARFVGAGVRATTAPFVCCACRAQARSYKAG